MRLASAVLDLPVCDPWAAHCRRGNWEEKIAGELGGGSGLEWRVGPGGLFVVAHAVGQAVVELTEGTRGGPRRTRSPATEILMPSGCPKRHANLPECPLPRTLPSARPPVNAESGTG